MEFLQPRARIDNLICVSMLRERFPHVAADRKRMLEYVREMELVQLGKELTIMVCQRIDLYQRVGHLYQR